MDNRTRCVEYVDKREFDLLKQEVQALRQKMENMNKPYGPYSFPDNQKYTLNGFCGNGIGDVIITLASEKGEVI